MGVWRWQTWSCARRKPDRRQQEGRLELDGETVAGKVSKARVVASALSAVRSSVRSSTSTAQSSVALHTERREEWASFLRPSLY